MNKYYYGQRDRPDQSIGIIVTIACAKTYPLSKPIGFMLWLNRFYLLH